MDSNNTAITRTNFYYDESDFNLDMDIANEYVQNDLNFIITLYRVDHSKTDTDDLYGESNPRDFNYLNEIQLKIASMKIIEAENKSYNPNSTIRYQQYGNLEFQVLIQELTEKNVDISYGDVVSYSDKEGNLKYWTVQDDGKIIADNKHTRYGFKGYYRSILCVTLDPNLFTNS